MGTFWGSPAQMLPRECRAEAVRLRCLEDLLSAGDLSLYAQCGLM